MSDSSNGETDTAQAEQTAYKRGEAPDSQSVQKTLKLPVGKGEVMPVEMAKWERLKRRIMELERKWSINWLSAGSSAALSVAISAFVAALSIPTGPDAEISPTVQPALFIGAAAALVTSVICFVFFKIEQSGRKTEASDIVDEMKTEEAAWEQRGV